MKLEKILTHWALPGLVVAVLVHEIAKTYQARIVGAPPVPHSEVIGATGSNAYFDANTD